MNVRLEHLLKKRLNDHLSAEEESELMSLIRSDENDTQLSHFIDDAFDPEDQVPIQSSMTNEQADRVFKSIIGKPNASRTQSIRFAAWLAAASIIVAFSVLLFTKDTSRSSATTPQLTRVETVSTSSSHQLIKLPDGSTVILNENSSLVFPENFSGNTREVTLIGEGYFDIKHDAHKTFIVHTGKVRTTVLGTAFNIRAYKSDQKVDVTVTRGRVRVSTDKQVLADLRPDQQVSYYKTQARIEKIKTKATEVIEWQSRDLFFDDVTLKEAATLLEQRFQIKILFADHEALSCRFSGTFLKGENLDEVLEVICSFNNCRYYTDDAGNKIISGDKCQTNN